jgi:hypothetical protein
MDHVGIDVQKTASQICTIADGGELIERRVRSEPARLAEVLADRSRARILIEASTESEWVARCLAGPRGDRGAPQLRPDVRHAAAEGEDRSPRRPGVGRRVCAGGVPAGASLVRRPAPRAGAAGGAGRAGAHADTIHRADPVSAAAGGLARADRHGGGVQPPGPGLAMVRAAVFGGGPVAGCHACGESAGRLFGCVAPRARSGFQTRMPATAVLVCCAKSCGRRRVERSIDARRTR